MNLKEYKTKLGKLSLNEEKLRDLYLRDMALGKIQGPPTGYASIDKPWLQYYGEESLNHELPKKTAYRYMYDNNINYQNEIAIEYFGNKITYNKLFKKIDDTAKSLQELGVKKGDIVTICSVTTPEIIYLFYALNKIGAIANMIDPRLNEERIIQIINETNSKLLFLLNLIHPKIEKIRSQLNVDNYIILSAFDSLQFPINLIKKISTKLPTINKNNTMNYKKFIEIGKNRNQIEEIKYIENYPAGIVYTGGTTGVPKGAILSNDNFNGMAYNYSIANLGIKRQQKILDIMPPFIAYGLNNGIHLPLSVGVTNIIIPKFEPDKFPDLILKYKPNDCLGVPSHFDILTKSDKLKNADLSFLVYPAVGGDAMNIPLEEKLNVFLANHNCSAKITKGYGMTELSGAAITSSTTVNKVGSVGIPFPLNNVGIFQKGTDNELQIGEIGEICLKSPTIMYGYLNNKEEERKVKIKHENNNIWIHSQDYGYIDENGFLYVKGRIKRTIVRPDGHNNYPLEIENVINSFDGVLNSAVIDIYASKYGNGHIPIAFVVMNQKMDKDILKKQIMDYCNKKLPNRDVACNIIFTDKLPTTNIGKIDYNALKALTEEIINKDKDFEKEVYHNYERTLILK